MKALQNRLATQAVETSKTKRRRNKAMGKTTPTKRGTADGYMVSRGPRGGTKATGSAKTYGKANPFAGGNGTRLKPQGAPAPYSKKK